MKRSFRLALALSCTLVGAACGPAAPGQTAQPAQTEEAVVVVPPAPSATATATAAPVASAPVLPSRPMVAAGNVEECIAQLRGNPSADDTAKPGGDVEYHDGLAAERSGSMNDARKSYFKLVQNYPNSPLIPAGYFAFGEMFANEAKKDPSKAPLAEQSFNEVLKFPPPANKLRSIAQYRLGQVLGATDKARALASLARAAKADREAASDGCAVEVAAAALTASIPIFADVGDPAKAWSFYLGLSGDGGRAAQRTLELAERLASARKGDAAVVCLASSVELGATAQPDQATRAAYCKRARAAGDAARASAAGSLQSLDRALGNACR